MKRGLVFWISIFLFLSFVSDSTAKDKLTLKQSIGISLENNNSYKAADEAVNESSLKVREVWGMLWPTLSTDATYTRLDAEAGLSSSIEGQYNIKFVNGNLAVNPGIFYNSLKASRSGHIIAVNNKKKIQSETTIRTISLYYTVMLTKETVKLRKEALQLLDENLKTVTTGYNKGIISKLDYLRAKVAHSNANTMLINAENDYQTASSSLNIQLGYELNRPLYLDFTSLNIKQNAKLLSGLEGKKEEDLINSMIGESLKNRPELVQLQQKKEAELSTAKINESIYLWPTFFIDGSYGQSKSVSKDEELSTGNPQMDLIFSGLNEEISPSGWIREWQITVGATYRWGSWSPLDSTHAKSDQLKSKAKQTELQLKDFIKGVKLEVKRGYLKLKSAENSINAQKGNIETAEESLNVSIIQFRNGIIDNTKLIDANVQLTTARTLYIQSLYQYQVAKAELNKAIGIDYFPIE